MRAAGRGAPRILVEDGRAVGVECLAASRRRRNGRRRPYAVRARAVIVAGGALGTPELLLRSGLGGDQVGRNLHIHPACWVGARYEEEVRGWDGRDAELLHRRVGAAAASCSRRPSRRCRSAAPGCSAPARKHQEAMLGFAHVGSIGVHLSDGSPGRVGLGADGSLRASYELTAEDARRISFGIARAAEVHFAAGATEVYPNIGRVGVLEARRARRLRGDRDQARRSCGSRPFTRWAPRGSPPTPRQGVCARRRAGARSQGPLRRRRRAVPDLGRGQSDDDRDRVLEAGRSAGIARAPLLQTGSLSFADRAPASVGGRRGRPRGRRRGRAQGRACRPDRSPGRASGPWPGRAMRCGDRGRGRSGVGLRAGSRRGPRRRYRPGPPQSRIRSVTSKAFQASKLRPQDMSPAIETPEGRAPRRTRAGTSRTPAAARRRRRARSSSV